MHTARVELCRIKLELRSCLALTQMRTAWHSWGPFFNLKNAPYWGWLRHANIATDVPIDYPSSVTTISKHFELWLVDGWVQHCSPLPSRYQPRSGISQQFNDGHPTLGIPHSVLPFWAEPTPQCWSSYWLRPLVIGHGWRGVNRPQSITEINLWKYPWKW